MNERLIIYFIVGVIQDFLFTLNTKYVAKEKIAPAVLFSFLTILVSMLVLYNIINEVDAQRSIVSIVVYSSGIAVGTYLAMKIKPRKKQL